MEIDQKYEQDLKDKNFYNFLMKVKTDLRKLIRKENFQQYSKTFIIRINTNNVLIKLKS